MKKLLPLLVLSIWMLDTSANPLKLKDSKSLYNPSSMELMRMNVYIKNSDGSSSWVDGAVTVYGAEYSDDIDGDDGRKMANPGANVCVIRNNIDLVVERRQLIDKADTIFFKMWGLQKRSYEMRFVAQNLNHPALSAYLQDNYLHTETPVLLSDTTHINIDINNDAGSYASDRFKLVYRSESPAVPVPHFTAINAFPGQGRILLNWMTENDNNGNQYFIEKSVDGSHFIDIATMDAKDFRGGMYNWVDHFPADEYSYYRVKNIEANGTVEYSAIVTVKTSVKVNQPITVFPNPATPNDFNLKLTGQPDGNYQVQLFNAAGNVLMRKTFNKPAGVSSQKLPVNQNLSPGIYHLEIIKPTGDSQTITVIF